VLWRGPEAAGGVTDAMIEVCGECETFPSAASKWSFCTVTEYTGLLMPAAPGGRRCLFATQPGRFYPYCSGARTRWGPGEVRRRGASLGNVSCDEAHW